MKACFVINRSDSTIAKQEVYFYIFDSLPLLVAVAMFLVVWPPQSLDENMTRGDLAYPMFSENLPK